MILIALININKRKEWVERWEHKKTGHKVYKDGTLSYGELNRIKKHGKAIGTKFKHMDNYPFRNVRIREVDKDIASARDALIDVKVAIPLRGELTSKGAVKLKGRVYNIINVDNDHYKGESFLLLQINEEKILG